MRESNENLKVLNQHRSQDLLRCVKLCDLFIPDSTFYSRFQSEKARSHKKAP